MIEEAKVIELTRIVKTSLRDVARNGWLSVASTSIMALTLLIVGVFVVFAILVNQTAKAAENKVNVAVINLKDSADSRVVNNLSAAIREVKDVTDVTYVSKEEALARFRDQHKDEPLILEAVANENPLLNSLEVKVADQKAFKDVNDIVASDQFKDNIDSFSFQGEKQKTAERIASISHFVNRFGFILSGIFGIMSLMIIFNTVRIAIFSRRTEIEIMQLVGATKRFIRYPFVLEGAVYGLIGALIAIAFVGGLLGGANHFLHSYFPDVGGLYLYLRANTWLLLTGEIAAGIVMGGGSSYVAVTRHLDRQNQ